MLPPFFGQVEGGPREGENHPKEEESRKTGTLAERTDYG